MHIPQTDIFLRKRKKERKEKKKARLPDAGTDYPKESDSD
jgi:hypothetical protein